MIEIDTSWTLFLDRDGVINDRILSGYITKIEEFHFLPGVLEGIKLLSSKFGRVFVVTNQQGIAKGLMTESNLLDIHAYMTNEIEKSGGRIDKCYYAPGLVSAKNSFRKPNPGMGLLAKRQYAEIDFSKSVMVGDTDSDILFGQNLGMKTVRVKTIETIKIPADITVESLLEFAKICTK